MRLPSRKEPGTSSSLGQELTVLPAVIQREGMPPRPVMPYCQGQMCCATFRGGGLPSWVGAAMLFASQAVPVDLMSSRYTLGQSHMRAPPAEPHFWCRAATTAGESASCNRWAPPGAGGCQSESGTFQCLGLGLAHGPALPSAGLAPRGKVNNPLCSWPSPAHTPQHSPHPPPLQGPLVLGARCHAGSSRLA